MLLSLYILFLILCYNSQGIRALTIDKDNSPKVCVHSRKQNLSLLRTEIASNILTNFYDWVWCSGIQRH